MQKEGHEDVLLCLPGSGTVSGCTQIIYKGDITSSILSPNL